MRLPALSLILAVLAVVWCFAGSWVHSPKILLYPLVWGLIAAGFYVHVKMYPLQQSTNVDDAGTPSASPNDAAEPPVDSESKSEKLAAGSARC